MQLRKTTPVAITVVVDSEHYEACQSVAARLDDLERTVEEIRSELDEVQNHINGD